MSGRRLRIGLLLAALAALVACASAYAIRAEIGKTVVSATAELQPRELPANGGAPVTLSTTTRIGTKDGSVPPALKTLTFELDKNGFVETKGLPTCTMASSTRSSLGVSLKSLPISSCGEGVSSATFCTNMAAAAA